MHLSSEIPQPFLLATSRALHDGIQKHAPAIAHLDQAHGMLSLEPVTVVLVLLDPVLAMLGLAWDGITNCSVVAVCFHNW